MTNPHGFTWRERLADWISGGALTHARISHQTASARCETWLEKTYEARLAGVASHSALRATLAATENGKSGTAQKIARMAREALE